MSATSNEVEGDFVLFVVVQRFVVVLIGQFLFHLVSHDAF